MRREIGSVIVVAAMFFLAVPSGVWALPVDDSFSVAKKIESQYFTIYLAPGVNENDLITTLDISSTHKILAGRSLTQPDSLSGLIDALFIWAGGVLDMQLNSYKGSIKIARDAVGLADIYRKLYGMNYNGEKGFYIVEINTLYIAAPDVTKEILGHEIGHAIISNFFVVQPPAKVQEVLAGYIEYQLRKPAPRR